MAARVRMVAALLVTPPGAQLPMTTPTAVTSIRAIPAVATTAARTR
ncbi:Uncharacterised protein [Mycobacteroides abscessus subsp. abscessus]|nr:Uncharacterised protein [Mycobacteroides abscessus subsp. abscessus]